MFPMLLQKTDEWLAQQHNVKVGTHPGCLHPCISIDSVGSRTVFR